MTIHTITLPTNGISDVGKCAIVDVLSSANLSPLPPEWCWDFRVGGMGEYVGTFSKRVGKYYHSSGVKLPNETREKIGNLASSNCEKEGRTYYFSFTKKFDWEKGDFADPESCLWGCHEASKEQLTDRSEFGIVLFFSDESGNRGIGRSLLWDIGDCTLVWNTYGFGDHSAGGGNLAVARILAQFRKHAYYKKIGLENNGEKHGDIWINCGAYAVGNQEDVLALGDTIDLEIINTTCCTECGDSVDDDRRMICPNGETYCESCYYEAFGNCENCGETFVNDDLQYTDCASYCEECFNDLFMYCGDCDTITPQDDIQEGDDDCYYCSFCWEKKFFCCEGCSDIKEKDEEREGEDGEFYCTECWEEKFFCCEKCGDTLDIKDKKEGENGEVMCEDCGGVETPFPIVKKEVTETLFPINTA